MKNPIFVDNEKIPLVTYRDDDRKGDHDNDCDVYITPNTTVEETTFTTSSYTNKKPSSTLWLRQKVKRDKLAALYRYSSVTGDLDLINLDQFKYTNNTKNGATVLNFYKAIKNF